MFITHSKGQTIIEVIIAVIISSLVVVAVAKLISSSFSNVDFSENQVAASSYAQQGMDFIGNIHDTDYATFQSYVNNNNSSVNGTSEPNGITYCLDDSTPPTLLATSTCLSSLNANIGSGYIRSVAFNSGGANCTAASGSNIQVTVKVQWDDSKCTSTKYCHNSQLVSCYSDSTVAPAT